jgi:hypothetical protein
MVPPAPWTRALMRTTYPSYLLPWMLTLVSVSSAASITWSQVTGCDMSSPAFSATDLRYQSSCVLAHCGATTSWSFQVAPSMAPSSLPSLSSCWSSSLNSAR